MDQTESLKIRYKPKYSRGEPHHHPYFKTIDDCPLINPTLFHGKSVNECFMIVCEKVKNQQCMGWRKMIKYDEKTSMKKIPVYDEEIQWKTYQEVQNEIEKFGNVLIEKFGVKRKDMIGMLSKTRKEWMITALSVWKVGGVTVTAYEAFNDKELDEIFSYKTTCSLILCESSSVERLIKMKRNNKLKSLKNIVYYSVFGEDMEKLKNYGKEKELNVFSFLKLRWDKREKNFFNALKITKVNLRKLWLTNLYSLKINSKYFPNLRKIGFRRYSLPYVPKPRNRWGIEPKKPKKPKKVLKIEKETMKTLQKVQKISFNKQEVNSYSQGEACIPEFLRDLKNLKVFSFNVNRYSYPAKTFEECFDVIKDMSIESLEFRRDYFSREEKVTILNCLKLIQKCGMKNLKQIEITVSGMRYNVKLKREWFTILHQMENVKNVIIKFDYYDLLDHSLFNREKVNTTQQSKERKKMWTELLVQEASILYEVVFQKSILSRKLEFYGCLSNPDEKHCFILKRID